MEQGNGKKGIFSQIFITTGSGDERLVPFSLHLCKISRSVYVCVNTCSKGTQWSESDIFMEFFLRAGCVLNISCL